MIRINLLPRETREQATIKKKLIGLISISVISLCLVIVLRIYMGRKVNILTKEVSEIEVQVAELKKKYKEIEKLKKADKDLMTRIEVIDNLKAIQSGPAPIFDELVSVVPKHIWLRELSLSPL